MTTKETSPHRSCVGLRLTQAVASKSGLENENAREAVKCLSLALRDLLLSDNEVAIPFLGVLRLNHEGMREFMVDGITYRIATKKRVGFTPYAPFLRKLFQENKRVALESEQVEDETEDKRADDKSTERNHDIHLCPLPIHLEVRQR
jgi:nucleoid DNA-binding protein